MISFFFRAEFQMRFEPTPTENGRQDMIHNPLFYNWKKALKLFSGFGCEKYIGQHISNGGAFLANLEN